MNKITYASAIAVAVMVTAGFAANEKKTTLPFPVMVNKYGQTGIWNTHSAKTLGKGRLAANIYTNFSDSSKHDYIANVYIKDAKTNVYYKDTTANDSPYRKVSVNAALGYGLASFLDFGFSMPFYADWLGTTTFDDNDADPKNNPYYPQSSQNKTITGWGDATVSLKFQYPPYPHRKFFEMAYYGALTLPTGNEGGRFVRNTYYIHPSDEDFKTGYYSSGKGKTDIDMKMLWTWDFREVADFFPVLYHINYGVKWTTQKDNGNAISFNTGLEIRPTDFLDIFLDFSAEPRMSSVDRIVITDPAITDTNGITTVKTHKTGLKDDPLRLSPGIAFLAPYGFNLSLGADISLANNDGIFYKQPGTASDGRDVIIETGVEPKAAFVASIGWNGFVIPQDADHDLIKDNQDLCPKDPEDRDGFMDTDGCPDLDNDNDSVPDLSDKCPNTAGPVKNEGCPIEDHDGDGIKDVDDACPDVAGVAQFGGCPNPDRDGDRVLDSWVTEKGLSQKFAEIGSGIDKCPDDKGTLENNGCPVNDKDGDGIVDKDDACPDLFGTAQFTGCPNPDRDADGIAEPWVAEQGLSARFAAMVKGYDKCPEQPETVNGVDDEDGCPDTKAVEIQRGAMVLRGVNFETGKAILTKDSYDNLDKVVESLKEYPEIKVEISGHTDNVGSADANKRLSYNRAKAVMSYFVQQGIAESRLRAIGKGMEEPKAENTTADGRALNRRVELKRID